MTPRGPDGCGFAAGPGFALGHRRLSIIDLSDAGSQPMSNEDGTIQIVFNGEIYNFIELRPELERAGHHFRSRTDTEVLIHGFEEWGLECLLRRIRGMYAFALVDSRRREIHLARDPLGKKPLFFAWANGELDLRFFGAGLDPGRVFDAGRRSLRRGRPALDRARSAGPRRFLPASRSSCRAALGAWGRSKLPTNWCTGVPTSLITTTARVPTSGWNESKTPCRMRSSPPRGGCANRRDVVGRRRFGTGCRHGGQGRGPDQDFLCRQRGSRRG